MRDVRGIGLTVAVEFMGTEARQRVRGLMERGVLAKDTHATTVRSTPPLVIDAETLDWASNQIIAAFADPIHNDG